MFEKPDFLPGATDTEEHYAIVDRISVSLQGLGPNLQAAIEAGDSAGAKKILAKIEKAIDGGSAVLREIDRQRKYEAIVDRFVKGNGTPEQAVNDAARMIAELEATPGREIENFGSFVGSDWEKGKNNTGWVTLGYRLKKFKQMEKRIDGLQPGLHGIVAGTNVGKSALMVNLAMDIVESNPETRVLYVSLDDHRKRILHYLYALLSGLEINQTYPGRVDGQPYNDLETAREALTTYANDGRFDLVDATEVRTVEDLDAQVRHKGINVLFIDGALKLSSGATDKRLAVEAASDGIKRIAEFHDIPVVFSHELRKRQVTAGKVAEPLLEDTKESAQVAYDMTTGFILTPADESVFNDERAIQLPLKLKYAKNKDGDFRGTDSLLFHRKYARIEELDGDVAPTEAPERMSDNKQNVTPDKAPGRMKI